MKKLKKLALLLLAVAVGNSAWAQGVTYVTANKAYVFTGEVSTGTGISYQWYRNGVAISGATNTSYTLPANLANGTAVEFKRGTMTTSCPGEVNYANNFVLTFIENGMGIGNLIWATVNVDSYQTFATRPDMLTQFYQWNRTTAYSTTDPLSPAWENNAYDKDSTWTVNPCPAGWRLPTQDEFTALIGTGHTWAATNAKGNALAGTFFGTNSTSCTLPSNMVGCIFLPAVGFRNYSDGSLISQGRDGNYWSSTQDPNTSGGITAYPLAFTSGTPNANTNYSKGIGMSIRCVQ